MNLSPLDVRRKQFDKAFRGYDPTEVDLFLKQAADGLEAALDEARRAEDRVRELEGKLTHYERVELALQEALESARETARRSEASAEEKARLLVADAELRAEKILHDAERERHGLRQDIVRLNSRQSEVAARLRGFLLSELEVLAQFQGDDPVGFLKLQSAGPAGALPSPQGRLEAPIDPPAGTSADHPQPPEAYEAPAPSEPSTPIPLPTYDEARTAGEGLAPEPEAPEPEVWIGASAYAEPEAPDEPAPPPIAAPLAPEPDARAPEPPASPSLPPTGAYAPETEPASGAGLPPAVTGGWDLRSLVTGEERSVAASDEERERIKRILDDLD
ncbi:DivIVA domain-containing protein [Rubrivirga sp. IMCC45206]|uniref:DivIVA domain-containing protein n=1 Tax=Rubrivirga sp. IMCC45206 TaxID=3391614 RepID=UPI0039900161